MTIRKKCLHMKQKRQCKICNPHLYKQLVNHHKIRHLIKAIVMLQNNEYIEFIGCDTQTFANHMRQFIKSDTNMSKYSLDHIKPVACFDMSNIDQARVCSHYSNLRLISTTENLRKNCKWTEIDNEKWLQNIDKSIKNIAETTASSYKKKNRLIV